MSCSVLHDKMYLALSMGIQIGRRSRSPLPAFLTLGTLCFWWVHIFVSFTLTYIVTLIACSWYSLIARWYLISAALWPSLRVPLSVVPSLRGSINSRYYPYEQLRTEAILSLDDHSCSPSVEEIELAFEVSFLETKRNIFGFVQAAQSKNHFFQLSHFLIF